MEETVENVVEKKSNGIGTAGFVFSLIGLSLIWIPILNLILWILGLIFSSIGVFRSQKGLAIAGLIISCVSGNGIALMAFFYLAN